MKFHLNHFKYRHQLIIFGLALGILPVLFLGTFSYFTSSRIIQKKVNETNLQLLQQTEMRVEEVLKSIQYYYFVLANSPTVNEYLDKRLTYRDYDPVMEIQQRLMGMQAAQTSVKNALYANFEHDWVISNQGMSSMGERFYLEKLNKIIKDSRNSFWNCSAKDRNIMMPDRTESDNPVDHINLVIKLPLNSNKPQGALIINLQGNEFIKSATQNGRRDEMILFDDHGEVILKDGNSILNEAQSRAVSFELNARPDRQGFYETRWDHHQVGISFRKSNYNGWTYVSVYNIPDITRDSRAIGWATMTICLVVVFGIVSVTVFGSTMIYSPIKNIYEMLMKKIDIHHDVRSNEFKLIEAGITTLVTKQFEMNEQIQSQMVRLEELFLIKLVNGELDRDNIAQKLPTLGSTRFWKCLSILAIQIDSFDNTQYDENDRDALMLAIHGVICNLIKKSFRLNPALINKVLVVLIGMEKEDDEEFQNFVHVCATTIQEHVKKHLGIGVSVGICRSFQDFHATHIAYKESIEALMCSIRFREETILYFEDVQPDEAIKQTPYPKNIEAGLMQAINHGETEVAEKLLNEFVDDISKKQLSFSEYQVCFTRLLINIIGILQDSGESIHNLFDPHDRLFDELYSLTNPCEIKKWFKHLVIHPCLQCLEERRGNQYKHILDQVIQMIQQEYDTDISLESCAARLNYHPSYIWRVLKKEMDITFSDYLAGYRLAMAKCFLEESDLSVGAIAEKLRYNNSQNFIRYFKKLEGITPGHYREKFRAQLPSAIRACE